MKKKIFVSLLSMLVGVVCFAQPVSVTGKVVDTDGLEVVGASVFVNGTKVGTFTDASGNYKLDNVPGGSDAVLTFSFIGYETKEVVVGRQRVINVTLEPSASVLDEVVYVAYGQTKKKDLTGSITAVDGNTIATQAQSSVSRTLDGQVPGLQIAYGDGQPGWDVGIRIRGTGTASQNNSNALIIIDGAPASSSDVNVLSSINPNDIASVTILKDAASTALYGSRGANGVILITTKTGKTGGKTKISFKGRWGVNAMGGTGYIDKASVPEYYEHLWLTIKNSVQYGEDGATALSSSEAATFASQHLFDYAGDRTNFTRNIAYNYQLYDVPGAVYTTTGSGTTASSTMSGAYLVNTDGKINSNATQLYGGDTYKSIVKPRFRQEYDISATGSSESEKITYHFSLGYLSDPSYFEWSSYERYTARSNVDAEITSWLTAGAKMSYTYRDTANQATRWGRNPGSASQNAMMYINETTPLQQLYARNLDGSYQYDENGKKIVNTRDDSGAGLSLSPVGPTYTLAYDILSLMADSEDRTFSNDISLKGYATITFLKDFKFTANISLDEYFQSRRRYYNNASASGFVGTYGSSISRIKKTYGYFDAQQLLSWSHDYGKHHVDALAGHEFYKYNYEMQKYASSRGLVDGFEGYVNFLGTQTYSTFDSANGGDLDEYALESYFIKANYIFDEKYYVSASLRTDGSSKFKDSSDRWGTFWSVGAGWRFTSEPWMEGTKGWLDNAKLRGSYGVIGNENGIDYYSGYQLWSYSGSNYTSGSTTYPQTITLSKKSYVNDSLTWEKVHTLDFGIDATLFHQKLSLTFDWYNRKTVNAIWSQPVSFIASGQTSLTQNNAALRNQGFEVDLSYQIFKNKDWDINFSTNGTHYNTKVVSVPDGTGSDELDGCWTASPDKWTMAGNSDTLGGTMYLRGEGKDYYNIYLYKYGGVAGNSWIDEYYGTNGLNDSSERGYALYYHRVTASEAAAGTYGTHVEGDDVLVTDRSLADRYEMGDALPDWIGGFSFDVRWKNWDLTAMFSYQIGGKFLSIDYSNNQYRIGFEGDDNYGTLSAEVIGDTWTEDNVDAKFPMAIYGKAYQSGTFIGSWYECTDLALFSASYLSVKNVTLGYTFPKKITNKLHISNLRLFASADNFWMLYSHSGIDPRWSLIGGMEVGAACYPSMASYNFGINIDF